MRKAKKIAVVGCGSGGPAAAISLAQAGHGVTVFERAEELGPVGAGFLLQPTGLQVLDELGCLGPILAHGAPVHRLFGRTPSGRKILDLPYGELGDHVMGVGMSRPVLLHYLCRRMEQVGVRLCCGVEIKHVLPVASGKTMLYDQLDEGHGPYDLLIVADGARSKLREQLGIPMRVRQYPWGALWFIGQDPSRRFGGQLYQVFEGTEALVGFLPTGSSIEEPDVPMVSLFWSIHEDGVAQWRKEGLEVWRREILRLVPQAEDFLAQIQSPQQVLSVQYMDVVCSRWHTDRVVLLGDAGHAMSPQLGQGVNLALWDAQVLADCMEFSSTVAEATALYTQKRRGHLGFYQKATRWVTPFFQSSYPLVGTLRDWFGPMVQGIKPFRVQMLRSMAGLKQGFFTRSMPVPQLGHSSPQRG